MKVSGLSSSGSQADASEKVFLPPHVMFKTTEQKSAQSEKSQNFEKK